MQVTSPDKPKYDKHAYGYFRLIKINDKAKIKRIENSSSDIKTIYEELWEELKYAYDCNKPTFMWNNMRRILETYNRFLYKKDSVADIGFRFEEVTDKALAGGLIKSLHVNSHVGYETDIDISGKTNKDLKKIFYELFKSIDAEEHFRTYWSE